MGSVYETELDRNPANYVLLSPLGFFGRTANIYPDRVAVVHGAPRYSWKESCARCCRLAGALQRRGLGRDDTIVIMASGAPEAFDVHFGVPMAGAVLKFVLREQARALKWSD